MKHLWIALLAVSTLLNAQTEPIDLVHSKWNAQWLTSDDSGEEYGIYHFRKSFSLASKPASFVVHVSGDNRYKLFVNGVLVSLGPARSDLYHWNFETVDIASYLKAGNNTLAAVVWNFGRQRALAQISFRTGFILQGNSAQEEIVNTNTTWKYFKSKSYSSLTPDLNFVYYALGPGERIDYNSFPSGWETSEFDDKSWTAPRIVSNGLPKGVFDWFYNWMLVPRAIPQMELTPQRFQHIRTYTGIKTPIGFPSSTFRLEIAPNTKVNLLLDQGYLTNAYPQLEFSKGKDASISLQYAEALLIDEGDKKPWKAQHMKGNRNDVAGKRFVGVKDEFIANGLSNQKFIPLDWRTFRYVNLQIETKSEGLQVNDISSIFTGYPFELKAKFDAKDIELQKIFETGWRTARLCAGETYVDCPYYEQLQYFGDTRIQCMISMFNTNDDRLVRSAITQADQSRKAEGMTLSRYPSSLDQQIPPFGLWWIGMVHDYYIYRNDPQFVKSFLPGTREVLKFFAKYQQEDGRLKNPPYWEFSDWAEGRGWKDGVPPYGSDGCSAVLDFQLLLAYQTAASLEEGLGLKELADQYNKEAARLTEAIRKNYWDDSRKLFFDTNEKKHASQHSNTLAILTETVKKGEAMEDVITMTLTDTTLTQATIYFKYYVNQALAKAGLGNSYIDQLGIWKENLKQGLTTWAEISDINNARSDCHAWGASPNIEFFRIVLGIDSDAPGFQRIKITPHLGNLKQVSGSMPHPNGEINVNYTSDKKGRWQAVVSIPQGTSGTFIWKEKSFELKAGLNTISI